MIFRHGGRYPLAVLLPSSFAFGENRLSLRLAGVRQQRKGANMGTRRGWYTCLACGVRVDRRPQGNVPDLCLDCAISRAIENVTRLAAVGQVSHPGKLARPNARRRKQRERTA